MFQFNLVTFLAVIVNFLIIYAVFRLFFYKPVKNIIEKREESIKEEFKKNQSLLDEAERKLKEAEEKFSETENKAKKIIKDAENIAEKMIQEKSTEAKKQAREIILSAEEQSKASIETANKYLKQLALRVASNLSLQMLSSIITPELDFELIKHLIKDLDSVEICDETGKKLIGIKEIMLSSSYKEKGIIIKSSHELPNDLREKIENSILLFAEKPININYEIDKSLCGGLILSIGFNDIDLSINGQVKNFAEQLS